MKSIHIDLHQTKWKLNLFDRLMFSLCVHVGETREGEKSGVLLDGLTHIQAHLHTVPGMMGQRLGQARHTVVTVSQDLDSHALILLKEKRRWLKRGNRGKNPRMIDIFYNS